MSEISTTQSTNYVSLVGVAVLILNHFKINIGSDELMTLIGAVLSAGGIIVNFYHRFQRGDLFMSGVRKF